MLQRVRRSLQVHLSGSTSFCDQVRLFSMEMTEVSAPDNQSVSVTTADLSTGYQSRNIEWLSRKQSDPMARWHAGLRAPAPESHRAEKHTLELVLFVGAGQLSDFEHIPLVQR